MPGTNDSCTIMKSDLKIVWLRIDLDHTANDTNLEMVLNHKKDRWV